ncbi:hypothetical protein SAMN05877838_2677 [Hoeflea halophila]|uniref:Aldose 1-epimerase n=1 Tax=Hoeflea halophila TaxID=714899 RepID=A0A286IEQ4_9HYPH|nr:hypothetical protein [Hoeflea halophila]SOE17774.1 hypothetical protein SAMN05877838_2677 [Hoeflea halophila]
MTTCTLEIDPVSLTLDLSVGHIAELKIRDGQRMLTPLHRAPWADDPFAVFPESTPPNVRRLSGDFFCAPFGRNDVEDAPSHGWPANSAWDHLETIRQDDRLTAVFRLQKPVMGAIVEKRITLIAGHPFVYQEHCFIGGTGSISAAHHVMVHMAEGGDLAVSPKLGARTPPEALEPDPARGRSRLAYPAESKDLTAFPLADGGTADLTSYPVAERHEDFLTLVEAPGQALAWSVVSRKAEQDRVIVLKRPDILPVTMLWMSNGGRDYAPWSGRHTGVLGIEDARASPLGHADSSRDNSFTRRGVATAFELHDGTTIRIRQIVGACTAEIADSKVAELYEEKDGKLAVRLKGGAVRRITYDSAFLTK